MPYSPPDEAPVVGTFALAPAAIWNHRSRNDDNRSGECDDDPRGGV